MTNFTKLTDCLRSICGSFKACDLFGGGDGLEYAYDEEQGRWITVHPNGAGDGKGRKIHLDENGKIDSKGPLAEALKKKDEAKTASNISTSVASGSNSPHSESTSSTSVVTPEEDAAYEDAVKRGDKETALKMIREAAAKAMPNTKVVGEDGLPKVVYHATNQDFTVFRTPAYFADTIETVNGIKGSSSTGRVVPAFLNIKEPYLIDAEGKSWRGIIDPEGEKQSINGIVWGEVENGWKEYRRNDEVVDVDGIIVSNVREGDSESYITTDYIPKDPSQIKSADITYDDNGTLIPLSKRFNKGNDDIRFSISNIYTGSAANYNEPSLIHVGTGEGSQVYGWGLYGSNVRGVAEKYAQEATRIKVKVDGRDIDVLGSNSDNSPLHHAAYWVSLKGSKEDAIEYLNNVRENLSKGHPYAKKIDDTLRELNSGKKFEAYETNSHIYSQTFFTNRAPGDESHLLSWYEQVSEENAKRIENAIAHSGKPFTQTKEFLRGLKLYDPKVDGDYISEVSGKALYSAIVGDLGVGPKSASEFLARADIDGIKYPVNSYGGKGVKDGDKAGWNYVSFRDDNVTVDHKWVDGEEVPVANTRNQTKAMVQVLKDFVSGIDVTEVDEDKVAEELGNNNTIRKCVVASTLKDDIHKALAKQDDNGNLTSRRNSIPMSNMPEILKLVGMPDLPIETNAGIVRKLVGKHGLTEDEIISLPHSYEDPSAVFADGTDYIILTGMGKALGNVEKPIMVVLRPTIKEDGSKVFMASAYPRTDAEEDYYVNLANRGSMLFFDKDKPALNLLSGRTISTLNAQSENGHILKPENISSDASIIAKKDVDSQGGIRKSLIIGPKGASQEDKSELRRAKKMLGDRNWDDLSRRDKVDIKQETGWEKGRDGKWRRETIDLTNDSVRKLMNKFRGIHKSNHTDIVELGTLKDILKGTPLEGSYQNIPGIPPLDSVKVSVANFLEGEQSRAFPEIGIELSKECFKSFESLKQALTHEIQHCIQCREGLGYGTTSQKEGSFSDYLNNPNEIEARNAENRQIMDRFRDSTALLTDTDGLLNRQRGIRKSLAKAGVAKQPIRNTEGRVAGWYDRNTGKVRLVKGVATPATVAHEIGWHATFHWAEKNHPALYKKLVQYAKDAPEGIEQSVKEKYGTKLTPNELLDEIGAERFTREDISPLLQEAQKRASEQFFDKVENEQNNLRKAFVGASKALSREELDEIASQEPKKAVEMLVQRMLEGRTIGGEPPNGGGGKGKGSRKKAQDSVCCDLWGGPYDIPEETEDAIAEDAYELKPDEKWITTKKGHHVVINTKNNTVVYGNRHVVKAIAGSKMPALVNTLNEIKEEVAKGHYKDANADLIAALERVRDSKEALRKEMAKMLNWGDISRSEKWSRVVEGMKGADLYTAKNAVDMLMEKLDGGMFKRLPDNMKEQVAEKTMGIIGSFLHNFGGADLAKSVVERAQNTIGKEVPSMKDKWPEFFSDKFYESVVGFHTMQKQLQANRAKDIQNLIKASDKVYLPDDAKALEGKLDEAIAKYGDMEALRTAKRRMKAIANGDLPESESGDDKKRKYTPLVDPQFPASLDELVEMPTPASFAKGYTHPRLFVDRSGKKWVLKNGGSEGHARAEHEASEVYRKLGILAPASKMYGNQRLAEYIEGTELGEYMRSASPEDRKRVVEELRQNFAADVILGNHDLIGDDEDNIMIGEDGRVWRVDNGGSLGKKGAGEDDPTFKDGWIDDLWTMRGFSPKINGDMSGIPLNPKLAKYFGSMDTNEVLQQAANMPWEKVIDHLEDSQFSEPKSEHGFKSQRQRLTKGRKEILKERIREMRALATTSKGIVEDGRYMPDYNDRLLKMTYALCKTPYRELTGAKSRNGVPILYDATVSGFVRTPISGSFKSVHSDSKLASENLNVNEQSLDSIIRKTATDNGIDLNRTDEMFADQGLSTSLGTSANKLKVMELNGMGYTLSQIAAGNVPDLSDHIKARVAETAKDYIANGGENGATFKADLDALMLRKASTLLFLQHANLPNYDPRTQRLLCVRTESDGVIDGYVAQHKGEVLPAYPRDSHASYSWFQTCTPTEADNLIAVSVPVSRITSCDLFPNMQGKTHYNQFHRQESEVGVNAFGLPFVYLGKTDQLIPINRFFKDIAEAEKRSGKLLTGETIKDENDYLRKSAPWSRME